MLTEYYRAARHEAALVEKDWLGIIKLTGSERTPWLQGMVTNDVARLRPGDGCYAAHLNSQGKMIAHFVVLADPDSLLLTMERSAIRRLAAAFDKLLIMEDVQVCDISEDYDILGVLGPKGKAVVEKWAGLSPDEEMCRHREALGCRIVRTALGWDIWTPRARTDAVLRTLAESGAVPIDRGTWDVIRTEAGLPIYGVDIDESTVMPELGERGISYDKGCYVGQEVVAKVKYIGHVNRKFVGLIIESDQLPLPKSDIRREGKDVGYVTTALFSPGLNKPIALGFVSRSAANPGAAVEISSGGLTFLAEVVSLPFQSAIANSQSAI